MMNTYLMFNHMSGSKKVKETRVNQSKGEKSRGNAFSPSFPELAPLKN